MVARTEAPVNGTVPQRPVAPSGPVLWNLERQLVRLLAATKDARLIDGEHAPSRERLAVYTALRLHLQIVRESLPGADELALDVVLRTDAYDDGVREAFEDGVKEKYHA